jgi:DNA mismatch endonuclease Vsr
MALWAAGIRGFRKNVSTIRRNSEKVPVGEIDIYFPRERIAVQVHGCLWHRHEGCERAYADRSSDAFRSRIGRNVERDEAQECHLAAIGVQTIVIWECELPDLRPRKYRDLRALRTLLSDPKTQGVIDRICEKLHE